MKITIDTVRDSRDVKMTKLLHLGISKREICRLFKMKKADLKKWMYSDGYHAGMESLEEMQESKRERVRVTMRDIAREAAAYQQMAEQSIDMTPGHKSFVASGTAQ